MKRTLIIIALLAILIPGALLAQDELTLENLAKTVAALGTDLRILADLINQTNDRLDRIEELLPATPLTDSDPDCILIEYHPDDEDYPSINVPLVHPQTYQSYRQKYGRNLDSLDIIRVSLHHENLIGIHYINKTEDAQITELYKDCQFQGTTEWTDR